MRKLGLLALGGAAVVAVGVKTGWFRRLNALLYDTFMSKAEEDFLGEVRSGLLAGAKGRVLDVGAGTGANFPYYPKSDGVQVVALDNDPAMLRRARRKAEETGLDVEFHVGSGNALPFANESFDTVVFTLSLCTIPDPAQAISEARRVLRPGGKLLFLEHVRADDPGLAKWQDRVAPVWGVVAGGCRPNQETRALIEQSGLEVDWAVERMQEKMPIPIVRPGLMGAATKN